MVDYKYKGLYTKSHIDKQMKIATDDGSFTATNSDIHFEDFQLTESLCSESELRFGSCESSMVKFQIRNAFIPLAGKWLTVTETLEGNTDTPFQYGRYKVFSDKPTADKEYRDIVAYDAMYDILDSDVTAWYNSVLPNKDSAKTLKQFRESFIRHFGLTEIVPEDGLVNDNMTVERTIDPEQISGKDVITAICEINGCFGHIGRDGKFHYIYLTQNIQGLYPATFLYPNRIPEQWDYLPQADTGKLYPQTPKSTKMGGNSYIKGQYEDYHVRQINRVQIRKEENDIGGSWPEESPEKENLYVIQDNFLVYGKGTEELREITENTYKKISGIAYRPFDMECVGNPCLEVGDPIRADTKYKPVESYILSRTLKGIQSKRDSYSAKGSEKRPQEVNSVQKSIIQLKGKTNTLTRTVEENRLEVKDIAQNLQSQILQNAGEIDLRVRKDGVIASINLSPEIITLQAQRIDLKGLVNTDELVSKFATVALLNVTDLRVQNLEIDHVSVSDFDAEKAKIKSIESTYITASKVKAEYMEVSNWTTAGKIKADRIDVGSIVSTISIQTPNMNVGALGAASVVVMGSVSCGQFSLGGQNVGWKTAEIDGQTITYLG